MRKTTFILMCVLAGTPLGAAENVAEITRYDTAQQLVCTRTDGRVTLNREVVFDLTVEAQVGVTRLTYRDGRPGSPPTSYGVRDDQVSCTVTPAIGEAAEPVRHYEGPHHLICSENGLQVGWPVVTQSLTERREGDTLQYDYVTTRGGSQQSLVISAQMGSCTITAAD